MRTPAPTTAVLPPARPAEAAMPWPLLLASCLAMFATTASGTTRAPFLIEMARDLEVGLPMVANLFGFTSVSWGIASFLAGIGSDRFGRRPFLVGGPIALFLALLGVAQGEGFLSVALWATVAGGCSGLFTGVSMAEVAAHVADRQRGRALGWVMSGQSLTLLVGVPLAAWLGASLGWRGVNVAVGGMALAAALAMYFTTGRWAPGAAAARRQAAAGATGGGAGPALRAPSLRAALTRPVVKLLSSVVAERICFGLAAVYYATFLQSTYELPVQALALPLAVFALGNIAGTLLGGQLADRLRNRLRTFAVALLASGVVALALFHWHPGLYGSVGLGFAYVLCNALARPSLMAAMANVPADVRGTVMGLNSTCASLGWLSAAALGGWMLATVGFAGFGPLVAGVALLGALLAVFGPKLEAGRHQGGTA